MRSKKEEINLGKELIGWNYLNKFWLKTLFLYDEAYKARNSI